MLVVLQVVKREAEHVICLALERRAQKQHKGQWVLGALAIAESRALKIEQVHQGAPFGSCRSHQVR